LKEVNVYRLYPLGYYCYLYLYLTLYRVQSSGHRVLTNDDEPQPQMVFKVHTTQKLLLMPHFTEPERYGLEIKWHEEIYIGKQISCYLNK